MWLEWGKGESLTAAFQVIVSPTLLLLSLPPLPRPTSSDVPPLEHLPVRTVLDLNLIAQYLINTGGNAGGFAVQDVSY